MNWKEASGRMISTYGQQLRNFKFACIREADSVSLPVYEGRRTELQEFGELSELCARLGQRCSCQVGGKQKNRDREGNLISNVAAIR